MQEQLFTSKSEHWCTPPDFLAKVSQIDTIGLDPCTNIHSVVGAHTSFDASMDGLLLSWQNYGLVFVNPPYGRQLPKWIKKIAAEGLLGTEIVALTPARTDTKFFHDSILPCATSVCLLRGRIKFIDGTTGLQKSSATFPSMVSYFGSRGPRFERAFRDSGHILSLR